MRGAAMRGSPMRGSPLRNSVIRTASVPAPVGGLNARDSIADMPPTDALILENINPNTTDCSLRLGYLPWSTGMGGSTPVETILPYRSGAGNKLFSIAGGKIYDCTLQGAVGTAKVSGLSNSRFQYVNFGTPGGQFVLAVNGADPMQRFDGANWSIGGLGTGAVISSITFVTTTATVTTATPHGLGTGNTVTVTGATPSAYNVTNAAVTIIDATHFSYTMSSNPGANASPVGSYTYSLSVTGFDTSKAININAFGQRVWLVEKNSFRVWYLPLQSIAGAATSIDLSSLFKLGGSLVAMVTWTVPGTTQTQQYAAFVSSEGEIVIYEGYDPASASTWALSGQARMGRPVGYRFHTRAGTDVVLIGADGFVQLSDALQLDRVRESTAVSDKIVRAAQDAFDLYNANFGWQVTLFPTGSKLFVNVPTAENSTAIQYVMNTNTGAWCKYTNLNANVIEVAQDAIYFGGNNGVLYQMESGTNDNGTAIYGQMKPAFNYFGYKVQSKFFQQVRPTIISAGPVNLLIDLTVNFQDMAPVSAPQLTTATTIALWDVARWDVALWAVPSVASASWQWVGGYGYSASARLQVKSLGVPVAFEAIDYTFEVSGTIY